MMEAMKDPVYICSSDYRIEYMNPAMIKRTGNDAAGELCFKTLYDQDKKCPWCMHHKAQANKYVELDIVSPKDNRSYHISQSPIVHGDGSISNMNIFRDTTDLLKLETRLRQAQKLIKSSLPSTIEIHKNIKNNCGLVLADPTQIHQIVMNLCTNAYHAMEETGGKLKVTLNEVELTLEDLKDQVMAPGPHVCLTVADTGPGMDQDIIARIFDPYFTTKETGKGTGLGLAVVHGIVKSHGGHISVYSEPGQGTEFQVYLPVAKKQSEPGKITTDSPIQKGTERILLVDDEAVLDGAESTSQV